MKTFAEKFEKMSPKSRKYLLFSSGLTFSFLLSLLVFTVLGGGILEWRLTDYWNTSKYPVNTAQDVAVVGINEELFEEQKFDWPLDKELYGELIFFLQEMGAAVISFDIEFTHNIDKCGNSDSIFVGMLENSPEVILGYGLLVEPRGDKSTELPTHIDTRFAVDSGQIPDYQVHGAILPYRDLYRVSQQMGFLNRSKPLGDGVDRKMPLLLDQDSLLFPSVALASVVRLKGDKEVKFNSKKLTIETESDSWVVDKNANIVVNFSDSIPYYPLSDILVSFEQYLMGEKPSIGKPELNGRIIFVGVTAPSLGDFGITPLSSKEEVGRTPNVFMHAQSAQTLLTDSEIKEYGFRGALLFSFVSLLFLYFFFIYTNKKVLYIVIPTIFIGQYFLGKELYENLHYIPVVQGIFASLIFSITGILTDYFEDNHEHRFLTSFFKTYLSPEYIEMMAKEQSKPKLGGESTDGTAFFTDIEKFSTFSEMFTPEELIQVLNDYFSKMTNILLDNNGTLDKYIGDAIVAFFGAPRHFDDHPYHACMAAYQMQKALGNLREEWKKDPNLLGKVDNMKIRIGLNSGTFITGNIGCDIRMNYTMIGDAVNLAARLESGAKHYGVYTLVGEETYKRTSNDFIFRYIDKIVVMGRSKSVSVYELIGVPADNSDKISKRINIYEEALELYFTGKFIEAKSKFLESQNFEEEQKVTPSSAMIKRCDYLIENSPEEWNGIFSMTSK